MRKLRTVIKSLFLASLIIIGHGSNTVFAMSKLDKFNFAQNNIIFYDPDAACTDIGDINTRCVSTGSGGSSDGSDVTWIGDSYSVESVDKILAALPNVDLGTKNEGNKYSPYSNIQYGKHLDWISNSNNNNTAGGKSGIDILTEIVNENKLRPTLVMALGTNDQMSSPSTKNTLEKIDELAKKGNASKVIILTAKTPTTDYTDFGNTEKKEFADSHDNFVLADWVPAYKDEYFPAGDIHPGNEGGYEAWLNVILGAIGGGGTSCTAGLLSGNTIEERIWNWFVNSNIEGVYNNPAVISGIMGNFYVESGYNPFMLGHSGPYLGLYMLAEQYGGSELKQRINDAVGKDFFKQYDWWNSPTTADEELKKAGATQEQIDTAVRLTLEWLTTEGDADAKRQWERFVEGINEVSDGSGATGAENYADLFLGVIENAYGGNDSGDAFKDPKVQAYVTKVWGVSHDIWQGSGKRRAAAADVYNRLANSTTGATPTTTSPSSATSTATNNYVATSSGGFRKYTGLTPAQIQDLAEVALGENGETMTMFKNQLSLMANLYEAGRPDGNQGQSPMFNGMFSPINEENLMKYIGYGGRGHWFATHDYVNGRTETVNGESVTSEMLDAVKEVFVEGKRTLPPEILEHDCFNCGLQIGEAYAIDDTSLSNNIIDDKASWERGKVLLIQTNGDGSRTGTRYIFYGFMGSDTWTGDSAKSGDPMGYYEDQTPSSNVVDPSSTVVDPCLRGGSASTGNGGSSIAENARKLAWPDKDHRDEVNPEFLAAAKALGQSTRSYCSTSSRELDYAQDCAIFVSVVVRTSGVDPDFPEGYTGDLLDHMSKSDKWEEIDNLHDESNLEPGDVFVVHQGGGSSGHTFIYIGDGKIASASLCNYTGQIQDVYFSDHRGDYHIFRSTVSTGSMGGGATGSFDADLKALEKGGKKVGAAVSAMGNKTASKVEVGGSWSGGRAWSTIKVPLAIAALQKNVNTTSYKDTYTGCSNSPSSLNLESAVTAAITKSDNCGAWWLWEGLGGNGSKAAEAVTAVIKEGGDTSTTVNGTAKSTRFLTSGYTTWSLVGQAVFASNMASLKDSSSVMTDMDNQSGGDSSSGLNTIGSKNLSKGGWGEDSGTTATRQFGIVKWSDGKCSAVAIGTDASGSAFSTLTDIAKVLEKHQSELPSGTCPSGV